MGFTNSSLVEYTRISPNRNSPRNQPITKITPHHMAGILSLEQFGNEACNPNREVSANYAIDKDGRIGLFCPESDRSWCSSSPWNDNRAVTIEVSNSATGDSSGWPVSDKVYQRLIDLCVDICKRNNIPKLTYTGDQNGSLTFHRFFTATACLPTDNTEVLTPLGWKNIKEVKIGDKVATYNRETHQIVFDHIQNMVEPKVCDTFSYQGLEATIDHTVIVYDYEGNEKVELFSTVVNDINNTYVAFPTTDESDLNDISKRDFTRFRPIQRENVEVSCITVETGFFVIRQGVTITIVGNCPGPFLFNKAQDLCNKVNARLTSSSPSTNTTTSTTTFKVGDLVSIASNATYYTGSSIPSWVKEEKWLISSISNNRAVLGLNEAKNRNIQSPIDVRYLTKATTSFKSYTKTLSSTDILYANPGGTTKGTVGSNGVFTIIEEKTVNNVVYGKLKSGAGWIIVKDNRVIKKGDKVKVINPVQYNSTKTFTQYVSVYYVLEVNGDRVVISSDGKNVTTAINKSNIQKI